MAQPGESDSQTDDHYRVLQVDDTAEPEVIEAAYRALSKKYHPDRNSTPDAQARMAIINAAYEVVGNSAKRADYDSIRRLDGADFVGQVEKTADVPAASDPAPVYTPPQGQFDRRARRFVYTYTPTRSRAATFWRAVLVLVLLTVLVVSIIIILQALAASGVTFPFPLPHI